MTKRITSGLVALLLAGALISTGCSSVQVTTDHDPKKDFSALESYAWLPAPKMQTGEPRVDDNPLLTQRIRDAVDAELTRRGLRRVDDPASADVLVGHYVTLEKKTDVTVVNDYYNYSGNPAWHYRGGGAAGQTYVTQYNHGSIIVDLIDAKTRQPVWRGVVSDEVNFSKSPEKRREQLRAAIAKLFEDFPPKGKE